MDERQRQIEARNQEFVAENTHVYSMGETAALDSREDEEGVGYGVYAAGFSWEGTMALTLLGAIECSSLDEAGLEDSSPASTAGPGSTQKKYIILKLKLQNRDGACLADPSPLADRFFIPMFVNLMHDGSEMSSLPEIVYFDGTVPDADSKGYFSFVLGKGQEKTFTVGLKVPSEDLKKDLFMGIGDAHYEKYRIKVELQGGGSPCSDAS